MLIIDQVLAQRIERAEALHAADYPKVMVQYDPSFAAAALPLAGGYAVATGPTFPLNRAVGLGMHGPVTAADLDQVEAFFRQRGLPVAVELCPLADESLLALLAQRAYTVQRFLNVFARPLQPSTPITPSAKISVAPISAAETELWVEMMASAGSGSAAIPPDHWTIQLARVVVQRPSVTCFLARVAGTPVGGAALLVRAGLATLFSASTLPAYRGQGVQAALLQARLAMAAAAGCDLAIVITVPGTISQRNVQRAGFQLIYTKVVVQRS